MKKLLIMLISLIGASAVDAAALKVTNGHSANILVGITEGASGTPGPMYTVGYNNYKNFDSITDNIFSVQWQEVDTGNWYQLVDTIGWLKTGVTLDILDGGNYSSSYAGLGQAPAYTP